MITDMESPTFHILFEVHVQMYTPDRRQMKENNLLSRTFTITFTSFKNAIKEKTFFDYRRRDVAYHTQIKLDMIEDLCLSSLRIISRKSVKSDSFLNIIFI